MASQQYAHQASSNAQHGQGNPAQNANVNRPSDEDLLPQGQERSEQMEHFQSFEASAKQTEDDVNQATLQREFPTIDSSLIAALYSDSNSLSATREMLMELTRKD